MRATHTGTHHSHISGTFYRAGCRKIGYQLILYERCHGGDVYYTFGNLIREGRPVRDDIDLPFSQFVVDILSSFVRSNDPNPDVNFLCSRHYQSTLEQVTRPGGIWERVTDADSPTLRRLDWPADQIPFQEVAQCSALGVY